jgi:hypothetical protein
MRIGDGRRRLGVARWRPPSPGVGRCRFAGGGLRPSSRRRTRRPATLLSAAASFPRRVGCALVRGLGLLRPRTPRRGSSRHTRPAQGGGPARRRGDLLELRRTPAAHVPLLTVAGTNRRVNARGDARSCWNHRFVWGKFASLSCPQKASFADEYWETAGVSLRSLQEEVSASCSLYL